MSHVHDHRRLDDLKWLLQRWVWGWGNPKNSVGPLLDPEPLEVCAHITTSALRCVLDVLENNRELGVLLVKIKVSNRQAVSWVYEHRIDAVVHQDGALYVSAQNRQVFGHPPLDVCAAVPEEAAGDVTVWVNDVQERLSVRLCARCEHVNLSDLGQLSEEFSQTWSGKRAHRCSVQRAKIDVWPTSTAWPPSRPRFVDLTFPIYLEETVNQRLVKVEDDCQLIICQSRPGQHSSWGQRGKGKGAKFSSFSKKKNVGVVFETNRCMNPTDDDNKLCLVFNGDGVSECSALAVANVLEDHARVRLVTVFNDRVIQQFTSDQKCQGGVVVVVPGGDERAIMRSLGAEGIKWIRMFVRNRTGTFIGICAGAAVATTRKRYSLSLVRLRCVDDNRDRETETVTLTRSDAKDHHEGQWTYMNGPWMVPMKKNPPSSITEVWRFRDHPEHIAACRCDNVHLFSVHPEFSNDTHRWLVQAAVSGLSGK